MNEKMDYVQEESLRKHYFQIPNVVDELHLDPFAFRLYCAYKKIASEEGGCFASNRHLAQLCCMSERQLIEKKKQLASPQNLLGGKPLIKIQKRITSEGDSDTDLITIIDIWHENTTYFKNKKIFRGGASGAPGVVHHMHQGGAGGAYKEEPLNNNQYEKESSSSSAPPAPPKVPAAQVQIQRLIQPSAQKVLSTTLDLKKEMRKRISSDITDKEFEEAWKRYEAQPKGSVKSVFKWLLATLNNLRQEIIGLSERKSIVEQRKQWAQESEYNCNAGYGCATSEGYETCSGNICTLHLYVADNDFWRRYGL